jgi:hypothetical protein
MYKLKYARFAPLRDPEMWLSLTKRQDCIIWNNGDVTVKLGLDSEPNRKLPWHER